MNTPLMTYRMTVEQFLGWADARRAELPYNEPKWELYDGAPEMQDQETWRHAQSLRTGTLRFDPPGIDVDVAALVA